MGKQTSSTAGVLCWDIGLCLRGSSDRDECLGKYEQMCALKTGVLCLSTGAPDSPAGMQGAEVSARGEQVCACKVAVLCILTGAPIVPAGVQRTELSARVQVVCLGFPACRQVGFRLRSGLRCLLKLRSCGRVLGRFIIHRAGWWARHVRWRVTHHDADMGDQSPARAEDP